MMAKQRQSWITTVCMSPKIFFQNPLSQFATYISFFFFLICSSVSSNLLGGCLWGFFSILFIYFGCTGSSLQCTGFSFWWLPLLQSTHRLQACRLHELRESSSVVVVPGLSSTEACGILPDQGPTSTPPHWQADSQPLDHQGSPITVIS